MISPSESGIPILNKGEACARCKARKVRCSGCRPTCKACLRTAQHRGVVDPLPCRYFGSMVRAKRGARKQAASDSSGESDDGQHKDNLDTSKPKLDALRTSERVATNAPTSPPSPNPAVSPVDPTLPQSPISASDLDATVDSLFAWDAFDNFTLAESDPLELPAFYHLPTLPPPDYVPPPQLPDVESDVYDPEQSSLLDAGTDWSYWGWLEEGGEGLVLTH